MLRKLLATALKNFGYHVIEAASPMEALKQVDEYGDNIQLLLTDIMMPDMNGFELAENLLKTRPGLPVLYISGYVQDDVISQYSIDKEKCFLTKPFSIPALANKIRAILDEAQAG